MYVCMVEKVFSADSIIHKPLLVFSWLPPPLTHTLADDEALFELHITLLPIVVAEKKPIMVMCIDENKLCLYTSEPHVMYTDTNHMCIPYVGILQTSPTMTGTRLRVWLLMEIT